MCTQFFPVLQPRGHFPACSLCTHPNRILNLQLEKSHILCLINKNILANSGVSKIHMKQLENDKMTCHWVGGEKELIMCLLCTGRKSREEGYSLGVYHGYTECIDEVRRLWPRICVLRWIVMMCDCWLQKAVLGFTFQVINYLVPFSMFSYMYNELPNSSFNYNKIEWPKNMKE